MDQFVTAYEAPEILGSFAAEAVLGCADGFLAVGSCLEVKA